ncbi:hypothetical protein ACFSKY_07800 [Azotobacter chroococcum]|uniref:Uncharacterized protein n=1 Tax=Azotobacter chroococcum TaxID=353 RepID=A0A4R1PT47_9GAMM|nr:hypothetical protein [Azotobacter chroococcum]TCL28169.1 hypothetical protein EV691_12253 [Azotobacter chroococcum]
MTDKKKADQQGSPKEVFVHDSSASPAELLAPYNSLNRFEAELLGDHCLNSTIAKLTHNYGLEFQRQPEKVPNRWGAPCDVIRYCLPESQHQRARTVLALLCKPAKGRKEVAA